MSEPASRLSPCLSRNPRTTGGTGTSRAAAVCTPGCSPNSVPPSPPASTRRARVLRIDELESRYGVSRTVVREAVRVLEAMHLVESRRRVGVTVRRTEEWNVFDPAVIRWRLAGADRPRQLRSLDHAAHRRRTRRRRAGRRRRHSRAVPRTHRAAPPTWPPPGAPPTWRRTSCTTSPSTGWCSPRPATRCSRGSGDVVAEVLTGPDRAPRDVRRARPGGGHPPRPGRRGRPRAGRSRRGGA